MFKNARLKLTAWYLLIIMGISMFFSIVIYRGATAEIERTLRVQQSRIYRINQNFDVPSQFRPDADVLSESEERIKLTLFVINLAIFFFAGAAGYFLAGITLRPIQLMLEEQSRFITDASHEFRTPITSLKTETEVFLRGKNNISKEIKDLLKSNLEEINSLQDLSNNLLELASYENEVPRLILKKTTLTELVEQAVDKVSAVASTKKIVIKTKIGKEKVYADKQSLRELFVILLDNSIKYSAEKSEINVYSKKVGKSIVISVVDQGIGIGQKDLEHIFDRFYRADSSRSKENISGYGLGLSIAKKIVESHGGEIEIYSEVDKGTRVEIKLASV